MRRKLKSMSPRISLFLFLLVVVGGGLHLNLRVPLVATAAGTPLMIHAFNCWSGKIKG